MGHARKRSCFVSSASCASFYYQKNRGGHPSQYPWDTVRLAILGYANLNRFDTRAELLKFTNDFIAQWRQQPTDRAIREFLRPIAEAMSLV